MVLEVYGRCVKFVDELTNLREYAGWSIEQLSYNTNISKLNLMRIEKHEIIPTLEEVIYISMMFHTTILNYFDDLDIDELNELEDLMDHERYEVFNDYIISKIKSKMYLKDISIAQLSNDTLIEEDIIDGYLNKCLTIDFLSILTLDLYLNLDMFQDIGFYSIETIDFNDFN